MNDKEAIELVKQLKDYCSAKECRDCPFDDKIYLKGTCLLKNKIPCNYNMEEIENAEK